MSLDSMRAQVVAEISRLNKILALLDGKDAPFPLRSSGGGGKRKMSAAARKRISEAQKARWAKFRKK